jgi:hypothetical protein
VRSGEPAAVWRPPDGTRVSVAAAAGPLVLCCCSGGTAVHALLAEEDAPGVHALVPEADTSDGADVEMRAGGALSARCCLTWAAPAEVACIAVSQRSAAGGGASGGSGDGEGGGAGGRSGGGLGDFLVVVGTYAAGAQPPSLHVLLISPDTATALAIQACMPSTPPHPLVSPGSRPRLPQDVVKLKTWSNPIYGQSDRRHHPGCRPLRLLAHAVRRPPGLRRGGARARVPRRLRAARSGARLLRRRVRGGGGDAPARRSTQRPRARDARDERRRVPPPAPLARSSAHLCARGPSTPPGLPVLVLREATVRRIAEAPVAFAPVSTPWGQVDLPPPATLPTPPPQRQPAGGARGQGVDWKEPLSRSRLWRWQPAVCSRCTRASPRSRSRASAARSRRGVVFSSLASRALRARTVRSDPPAAAAAAAAAAAPPAEAPPAAPLAPAAPPPASCTGQPSCPGARRDGGGRRRRRTPHPLRRPRRARRRRCCGARPPAALPPAPARPAGRVAGPAGAPASAANARTISISNLGFLFAVHSVDPPPPS